jgi:hypothetical protein
MAERVMEVEADSFAEARKKAESQVPENLRIVSEEILSLGTQGSVMGVSDTIEAAFEEAENKLPSGVEVAERQQIHKPARRAVTVEAADEQSARKQVEQGIAKNARVEEVTLKKLGKKGVFGMGRKPNLYEVQVFEQAVVEIKYKKKVKIRVKLGESPELWFQKLEKNDYHALTSLKIIEKSDPRFSEKLYDRGHDLYLTPLEFQSPYGGPSSLDEQQEDLQRTVQEILKFWKKPKISYSRNLEKKYELGHDELRIYRIETFRDSSISEEIMYIVRLGENAFFSWTRRAT